MANKHIDSEKLITEVKALKRRKGVSPLENTEITEAYMARGIQFACDDIVNLITSLQQEQPEVDLDAEIDKFLYGTKFKRDYDGVHVPGVCVRDWKGKKYTNRDVTPDDMRNFARHFAEWGTIHLNAKKEE